jgi:hypothetical protein
MCFFFKNKIEKYFAKRKMSRYEKYLHDCDDRLRLHENFIKMKNEKRLKEVIEYETNKLYLYPEFIR